MPAVDKSTIDVVVNGQWGLWHLGKELQVPEQFSALLYSLGYRPVEWSKWPTTKRGSWEIHMRSGYVLPSFLPKEQQPSSSAVAFYQQKCGENGGELGYLFMTKPGVEPDIGEMARNAQLIGSGVLEERIEGRKLVAFGAFGAAIGIGVAEGVRYFTGLDLLNKIRFVSDFGGGMIGCVAGMWFVPLRFDKRRAKALAGMRNLDHYLYGESAAVAVKEEFVSAAFEEVAKASYAKLVGEGVQLDRETFYKVFCVIQKLGLERSEQIASLVGLIKHPLQLQQIVGAVKPYTRNLAPGAA